MPERYVGLIIKKYKAVVFRQLFAYNSFRFMKTVYYSVKVL